MTLPQEQKALMFPALPGPLVLKKRLVPDPMAGDVLVKIESVGLNPTEYKVRKRGTFAIKEFPAMVGMDGAGVVVKTGDEVKHFEVGDRVLFQGWVTPDRATFQEYVLVESKILAKLPANIGFAEASTIPLGLTTAAFGLALPYDAEQKMGGAGLKPFWEDGGQQYYRDKPIVILGGASSVGQFVIQIAAYQGFSPIITTASLHNADYLKGLGATHVIDRNLDVASAIKDYVSSIDLVYDAVHSPITQTEVDLLSPGGTLVSVAQVPESGLDLSKIKQASYFYGMVISHPEFAVALFGQLSSFLQKGTIKANRIEVLSGGLAGISKGLDRMEKGEVSGIKLVASPPDTPQF